MSVGCTRHLFSDTHLLAGLLDLLVDIVIRGWALDKNLLLLQIDIE